MELYAKVVVDCINGDDHFVTEMGLLIEEIRRLLQCIPESVVIMFVSRGASQVAHMLVRLVLSTNEDRSFYVT